MSAADSELQPEGGSGWSPARLLAGFDASLLALRDELTPGQRWTAGLAAVLGLGLLLYGQPTVRVVAPVQAAAPPATSGGQPTTSDPEPTTDAGPGPGSQVVMPPPVATGTAPPPLAPAEDPAPPAAPPPDVGTPQPTAPATPTVPLVTALVAAAPSGSVPGHTEQDVASAFLADATFNAVVQTYDPETTRAACDAAAERDVVLAGTPLPRQLRDCLLDAGLLVVSHDDRGGLTAATGDGELVSTRPGVEQALLEAAAWGRDGALSGAVGLAVDPSLKPEVEAARGKLEEAGIDLAAVEYVQDVRQSVLAFSSAGVEVTAFLLPVELQREWVTVAPLVGGTGSYVVLDAADAVTTGGALPPTFDGARAFGTALPTTEPTEEQADCNARWESSGGPALGDAEAYHVLMWCQLADLTDAAATSTRAGTPFRDALTGTSFTSPLTTPLGPGDDGSFGPTASVEYVWATACRCWQAP